MTSMPTVSLCSSFHDATQLGAETTAPERERVAGHGRSGRPRAPAVALHGGRAGRALPGALRGLQPRRAAAHPAGRGRGGRTRAGRARRRRRRRRLPQRRWRRAGTHRAGEAPEAGARVCTHPPPTLQVRDLFLLHAYLPASGSARGVFFFIWLPLFTTRHCPLSHCFVMWEIFSEALLTSSSLRVGMVICVAAARTRNAWHRVRI